MVIQIERFQVAPLYDSKKISYSETPFTVKTFSYHKWQADPGELVSYFLARDIRQSSLFKAVITNNNGVPSSHRITGIVDEFFEQDRSDLWEAVLTVSITLVTEDELDISKRILLQKKYLSREKCKEKHPRAIAEAMSRAMAKVSEMIATDIYQLLSGEI
jgi:cholesterol transport system auxiliary component